MKLSITNGFARHLEDPERTLRYLSDTVEFGLPASYWTDYLGRVAAIKAEDVQRVARKYLPAGNPQIVAVGDARLIRDALGKFGLVQEER